jgi:hypothetical protein
MVCLHLPVTIFGMLSFPTAPTSPPAAPENTSPEAVDSAPETALRVLDSIVSELEILRTENANSSAGLLIDLHGALFLYELGGDLDRLPTLGFSMSSRRLLERRVVLAARRLGRRSVEADVHAKNMERANQQIAELIHLIDPELRPMVQLAS